MNPTLIAKCFEVTVKNKLLNNHLFENNFHVLFWRRKEWFGPTCYPLIIKCFLDLNYENDPEFWNDSILKGIKRMELKINEQ